MSKADKLKKKATEFEAKRQTDKAIAAYLELFREWAEEPEGVDVALYNRVGDMLLRAGNVGDAMTVWETAVDHYAEGGFHNNAIALCNKILRNSPGRSSVYYKLGKISAQKGFRGDAKKNYLEYADRMQKAGQIDEAFRALKEFADLSPEDSDIRQMLADQLTKLGRSGEAIEQLQILYERYESTGDSAAAATAVARMRAIDPAVEPKRSGPRRPSRPAGLVFLNVDDAPVLNSRKSVPPPAPPPQPTSRPSTKNSSKYVTDAKTRTATEGLPLIDLGDEQPPEVEAPPVEMLPEPVIPEPMMAIATLEDAPAPIVDEPVSIIEEIVEPASEPTIEPLILDQPPSVEYEDAPSLIQEDVPQVVIDDVVPLITDDSLPVITDDSLPFINDDSLPLINDDSLPLINDDSLPLIKDDSLPLIEEEASPLIEEEASPPIEEAASPLIENEAVAPVQEDPLPFVEAEPPAAVIEETPPPAPPEEPPPLAFQDISFGASFGTGDDQHAETTPHVTDLETNAVDGAPEVEARVSSSLSDPEDLTFGTGDVEPFSSAAGDAQSLDLVDAPVEFGASSAAMHSEDSSIEFDPFDTLDPVEPIAPGFPVPSIATPDSVAISDAVAGIDQMITAPPAGEMSEEEAPAPREAIQRKSMRPTMSALALSVDSLREQVRADVTNWHLRRQFAEALLEDGDREGGLEELETAMVGYERARDYESARSVAEEIIRLQPLSVRHHQKRVEYSYRMNDRARLIDAYLDLADALFQEGEAEKAKVVYERVLDLAPDDVRAIAAMSAFAPAETPPPEPSAGELQEPDESDQVDTSMLISDADLEDPPQEDELLRPSIETAIDESFRDSLATPAIPVAAVPEPIPAPAPPAPPPEEKKHFADSFADTYKPRMTPYVVDPIKPRVTTSIPKVPEKKTAETAGGFVDLEDWLKEDEAPKSTRMVIPEQAPTGDETADFNDMLRKFKQGVAKNVEDEDHESHYDLGIAFKEMGLIEEAIAEFQKALRSPQHRVRTYEALGQCFLDKSQEQVAITILQRALSEPGTGDDKLIGVLYLLGVSSETLGQPREAVKYYQRVFAVDINFRDVRKRMREIEQAAR